MYFYEYSNVAHGIKVTVQHQRDDSVGSILSDKAGVTSEMKQSSNSGENAPKVAIWRSKSKNFSEGALHYQ